MEIYLGGLSGKKLSVPVPLAALEKKAAEILTPEAYDYVAGGAGGERTLKANLDAFSAWDIVPRMLRDVSQRDLEVEVLGQRFPVPVMLGPVGVQSIVHADAEVASGKAAASLDVPFVLSTLSSRSLEEVAQAMGGGNRWFQLYWGKDPEVTASMLLRAEKARYSAVVVTLDTQVLGWRERDLQYPYLPFLQGIGLANYFTDPVFRGNMARTPEEDPAAAVRLWAAIFGNTALTWKDLAWLREHTRLPVVLKGVLHPRDAERAVELGMDGVIVSNHGGRQVDGSIASLDALPQVAHAVRNKIPVLFDSGIRRGADALKALALGARAVLLGRLYVWGLAVAGEEGVRDVLQNFIADFDLTLGLSGYSSCRELGEGALRRR
jgi:isopentenyl diphosphate isomerase/L-lactate dehydrogenase-like FMN-dependent dehydrogenase